jgi:hypothetical protein
MITYVATFGSKDGAGSAESKLRDVNFESDVYTLALNSTEGLDEALKSTRWGEDVETARTRLKDKLTSGGSALLARVGIGGGTKAKEIFDEVGAEKVFTCQKFDFFFSDLVSWHMTTKSYNMVRDLPTGWMPTSLIPLTTSTKERGSSFGLPLTRSGMVAGGGVTGANTFITGMFGPLVLSSSKKQ